MDVLQAIYGRRSVRAFRDEPVDRSLLETLIAAAARAPLPPASGDEPWAFAVLHGRGRLAALGRQAKEHARRHQPRPGAGAWCERPGFEVFWGAPAAVVIGARDDLPEAPFDCCRAGQSLVLAAQAAGLGSCWLGAPLPWLQSDGVAAALGLAPGHEPVVVIAIGHAAPEAEVPEALLSTAPRRGPRPMPVARWIP